MYRKTATLAAVGLLLLAFHAAEVAAQQPADANRSGGSLADRIDQFGRNLVGGIFQKKDKKDDSTARSANGQAAPYPSGRTTTAPLYSPRQYNTPMPSGRTGYSAANTSPQTNTTPLGVSTMGQTIPSSSQGAGAYNGGTPMRITRPSTEIAARPSSPTETTLPAGVSNRAVPDPVVAAPRSPDYTSMSTPSSGSLSLHERLMGVRESAFDPNQNAASEPSAEAGQANLSSGTPGMSREGSVTAVPNVPYRAEARITPDSTFPTETPLERVTRTVPERPAIEPVEAATPTQVPGRDPILPELATTPAFPNAVAPQTTIPSVPAAPADTRSNDRVLFASQSPILNVRTIGPRRISVGKESTYEVFVENLGKVAADNVVVNIGLPEWADVLGAEATTGATLTDRAATDIKQFRWKVGPLAAHGQEKIVLRIVPRQSRPIDLKVKWDYTPVASQTVIEVQEPKLAMNLDGPREVLFGKKETYRLEIVNSGTGDAENVVLTLLPIVPGEGVPSNHSLGIVAAGTKKVIEIELTARQKGTLNVRVDLRCDGDVRAKLDEKLLVRKADLQLAADGPQVQFVGTVATYQFVITNPGNATANDIVVSAKIPATAKYLASDASGMLDAERNRAVWKIKSLAQGAKQVVRLQCQLVQDGFSRIEVEATGKAGLMTSAAAVTKVEAMADLALEVSDPPGPVPVGQEATYEIRIHNRGTKRATGVEVVAYFSRGIEPVAVQGSPYNIGPGQVVFDAIGTLPAGKDIVLKIKARADAPGNHMFRTEVYCKPLGTRLVGEETTHFYRGNLATSTPPALTPTPSVPSAPPGLPAPPTFSPLRTADQRNQPTVAPIAPGQPTVTPIDASQPTVAPSQPEQPTLAPLRPDPPTLSPLRR
ncbi:MAG: hypothetical protein JW818_00240 [Pirellulales bacterium]|nr:hypothetical protein [Pirellulales bacterium]